MFDMFDFDFREFVRENKDKIKMWVELVLIFAWACLRLIASLPWAEVLLIPVFLMGVIELVRDAKLGYKYRVICDAGRIVLTAALVVCIFLMNEYPEIKLVTRFVAIGLFLVRTLREKV